MQWRDPLLGILMSELQKGSDLPPWDLEQNQTQWNEQLMEEKGLRSLHLWCQTSGINPIHFNVKK